jgi:hypothetical protein
MAMGTSVFRIRTTVDFPPVLKSDHTMRSCSAASLRAGRPDSFFFQRPARTFQPANPGLTSGLPRAVQGMIAALPVS